MAAVYKKIAGTTSTEFYIGTGDITQIGQDLIGFRSNNGTVEYREAGGAWTPLSLTSFDVDTILTDDVTGQVLVDDVTGNVLVNE